jgi:predicted metal-dependent hydrolase
MPENGKEETVWELIHAFRDKIRHSLRKAAPPRPLLDDTCELQTHTFKLHIFRTDRDGMYMNLREGILHIACPLHTDFRNEQTQHILKALVERALRHEAQRVLPPRLAALASQYGFSYAGMQINNAKSRWGSCNIKRHINLSLSLMLLPKHLMDYVLLHELCHTVEMNHSERFWELMNRVTANRALLLRQELKSYRML